jgi:hypothetical protein
VTGSHTYANPSPPVGRVVRVTVVDSAGERSIPPFAVSHARVADAPITVSPGSNFSAVVNSVPAVPVVVATFTDADPNPFNGTKLKDTATINWGDGVVTAGVITENSSTHVFSVTGTRVFPRVSKADPNNPGSYIPFNVVTSIRDTGVVRGTAAVQGTITPPLPTTTPNLVGTYTGTVNVKVKVAFITVGKNEPMVIQINSQNLESISGSITIDGTTVASGTFNGAAFQGTPSVERTNGLVIFSDTGSGFSVNVVGKIITNKATGLADTFAGNIVASGIPVIGKLNASFILTKTA